METTENTVIENNRLIADFMNITPKMQSPELYSLNDAPFFYCTETTEEKCLDGWAKYSKYHSSWDWLMPVVEKIEKMSFSVTIQKHVCRIDLHDGNWIIISEDLKKIESVYKAVIVFIKWYNENK